MRQSNRKSSQTDPVFIPNSLHPETGNSVRRRPSVITRSGHGLPDPFMPLTHPKPPSRSLLGRGETKDGIIHRVVDQWRARRVLSRVSYSLCTQRGSLQFQRSLLPFSILSLYLLYVCPFLYFLFYGSICRCLISIAMALEYG